MDRKTLEKINSLRPDLEAVDFSLHKDAKLTYAVTIGGDGTILYTAK